jgi:hypothetical protein
MAKINISIWRLGVRAYQRQQRISGGVSGNGEKRHSSYVAAYGAGVTAA